MDILQGLDHLKDVTGGFLLGKATVGLGLKVFVELAFGAILKDEIYFLFIVEKAIELYDILMT